MEFSGVILEVDGGFANPAVLVSMSIWLLLLVIVFVPSAVMLARRKSFRHPIVAAALIFCGLILPTQFARVVIGSAIYRLDNPRVISVGFWGGSAPLAVPLAVASIWLLFFHRERKTFVRTAV
jgi:hypothetical protein